MKANLKSKMVKMTAVVTMVPMILAAPAAAMAESLDDGTEIIIEESLDYGGGELFEEAVYEEASEVLPEETFAPAEEMVITEEAGFEMLDEAGSTEITLYEEPVMEEPLFEGDGTLEEIVFEDAEVTVEEAFTEDELLAEIPTEYEYEVGAQERVAMTEITRVTEMPAAPADILEVKAADPAQDLLFTVLYEENEIFIIPQESFDRLDLDIVTFDNVYTLRLTNAVAVFTEDKAALEETFDDAITDDELTDGTELNGGLDIVGSTGMNDADWDTAKSKIHDYSKNAVEQLTNLLPGGSFLAPLTGDLFDLIVGGGQPDKIDEIALQLGEMREEIKILAADLKNHVADITLLSEYGDTLDTLSASNEVILMNLASYAKSNLPENDKMVLIASTLGSIDNGDTNKFYNNILKEAKIFNGTSYKELNSRDIFQLVYDKCCSEVMFSKEAKDNSRPYAQEALEHFYTSYALAMTALEANLKVTELTPEEVAALGDEAKRLYPSVSLLGTKVIGAMETLNGLVTGNNSITTHWNSYNGIYDYTFVNKRNAEIILSRELSAQTYSLKEDHSNYTLKYRTIEVKDTPGYFKTNALSAAQVKDLAAYCTDKGKTLKDFLLNTVGFTATVKSNNCYLLTGSQSVKHEKGMCFGYCAAPEWDTCKAINMNKAGAKDQTINVWANNSASDKKPCNDITFLCFSVEDDAVATGLVLVKK